MSSQFLPLENIRRGPINTTRNLAELRGIASAMVIDTAGTKKDLITRINAKFAADQELAQKPEFLPFHSYRTQKMEKSSKNGRNSASKDAEDAEEAKSELPATGANKKLLDAETPLDPPGRFKRLSGPSKAGTKDETPVDNESDSGLSSVSLPADEEKKMNDEERPQTPPRKTSAANTEQPMQIYVNFTGKTKREIIIESGDRVEVMIEDTGNGPVYSGSLKEILAEAIDGDSPMKAHPQAKIYRQGVNDPEPNVYPMKLGSIEELLTAVDKTNLRFAPVDKYALKPIMDGQALACDLFTAMPGDEVTKVQLVKIRRAAIKLLPLLLSQAT
ncbi:hypothetical protein C8F04DRAFT_1274871 [Mycena alexandri]|uniref:Uncharacterized protein n=1 Tax=Mycena alexandri TaxID=1745969 RepID=A0AAD6S482_9AGAR|nr:hypothetical protein C8F04DRAFT_1274871 [Mycena alexandri]